MALQSQCLLENKNNLLHCTFPLPQSLMHTFPIFPSSFVASTVSRATLFLVSWLKCLQ